MAILKKEKQNFKPDDIVVVTVSGRGDKDMDTYVKYFKTAP
jgi:tryptophan synthase beta chain